jgi:hypothetical protein
VSAEADVRPVVRGLLVAVAVFLAGAVAVAFAIVRADDDGPVRAGPGAGERLGPYVEERHEALDEADGPVVAVVSFRRYLPDEEVAAVAQGDVSSYLVAVPGSEPEMVPDVEAWRSERLEERRREARSFRKLIPTVDDPEFVRQYEHDLAAAQAAVAALRSGEPVVFGIVVRAGASQLRDLPAAGDVRLVDVMPSGTVRSVAGVRPEERTVAGQPPRRP